MIETPMRVIFWTFVALVVAFAVAACWRIVLGDSIGACGCLAVSIVMSLMVAVWDSEGSRT